MRALTLIALAALAASLGLLLLAGLGRPDVLLLPLCGPGATSSWTFDAWVMLPLGVSGALYLVGTCRLWRRAGWAHGVRPVQAAAYTAGWIALAGALASPLHRWGGSLFAWHMIEHEIVTAVAAPLLVVARPGAALLWALPRAARHAIGAAVLAPGARTTWRRLTRPAVATTLHGIAIWAWHAPPLFEAAVVDVSIHRLQHVAFLLTALLFWQSLRRSPGAATGCLALTMLHTSLLGALLTLSPRVLFPVQTAGAFAWGLTPLEDQQLAGLIMWAPAGALYAAAALWSAARWIQGAGARHATHGL